MFKNCSRNCGWSFPRSRRRFRSWGRAQTASSPGPGRVGKSGAARSGRSRRGEVSPGPLEGGEIPHTGSAAATRLPPPSEPPLTPRLRGGIGLSTLPSRSPHAHLLRRGSDENRRLGRPAPSNRRGPRVGPPLSPPRRLAGPCQPHPTRRDPRGAAPRVSGYVSTYRIRIILVGSSSHYLWWP